MTQSRSWFCDLCLTDLTGVLVWLLKTQMRRKGISGTKEEKSSESSAEPRASLGGGSMMDNLAAMIPSGAPEGDGSGSEGEWDD